eukprot:12161228-Prorocentrum_lima.AAC.1
MPACLLRMFGPGRLGVGARGCWSGFRLDSYAARFWMVRWMFTVWYVFVEGAAVVAGNPTTWPLGFDAFSLVTTCELAVRGMTADVWSRVWTDGCLLLWDCCALAYWKGCEWG